MVAYATQADVYTYGLPRGSLGNPGRIALSAPAATSIVTLAEHGYATGDPIMVRVTEGGSLPSPLVAGTQYYALYLDDDDFQVASSSGGGAITFTTDADNMIVTGVLPFAQLLEYYSRFVDGFLPAHAVPLATPYPITVVAIVATLTARRIQLLSGVTSVSMKDEELSAKAQLERWATGIPARDAASTQQETNLAIKQFPKDNRIGSRFGFPGRYGFDE